VILDVLMCAVVGAARSGTPSALPSAPSLRQPATLLLKHGAWEAFLRPVPARPDILFDRGVEVEGPDDAGDGQHFLVKGYAPFEGGVDLYTDARGFVTEGVFYLVAGPLYLQAQIDEASRKRSPWTLADLETVYGRPDARGVSKRTGATIVTWKRGVHLMRVQTLPGSSGVHRFEISRDAS
jgi:hypothetical protein